MSWKKGNAAPFGTDTFSPKPDNPSLTITTNGRAELPYRTYYNF